MVEAIADISPPSSYGKKIFLALTFLKIFFYEFKVFFRCLFFVDVTPSIRACTPEIHEVHLADGSNVEGDFFYLFKL